jgi:TnpA family transposase
MSEFNTCMVFFGKYGQIHRETIQLRFDFILLYIMHYFILLRDLVNFSNHADLQLEAL